MDFVYLACILIVAFVLFFKLPTWKRKSGLLSIALWIGLIGLLALLYDVSHHSSEYISSSSKDESIYIRKSSDGHFYIVAYAQNNKSIRLLLDTGATDIILTPNDAKKIGFSLNNLNYSKSYNTSNGVIKAAAVVIPRLKIGSITANNVRANIANVEGGQSLLGMSFIENFAVTISEDSLTLSVAD